MSLKYDDALCWLNPDRQCPIFATTNKVAACPMAVCHTETNNYACAIAFLAATISHESRIPLAIPAKEHDKKRDRRKGITRLVRFK